MFTRTAQMLVVAAGLFGAAISAESAQAQRTASPRVFACGDDQIRELALGPDAAVEQWRWTAATAPEISAEWQALLAHIDDCKPVDGGRMLLATSSTGGTILIERASGHVLFRARTPMAHSADLLPGGLIAVALSLHEGGNRLQIYRRDRSEAVLAELPLHSGHGAVWDERRKQLFVLSHDAVQALAVTDRGTGVSLDIVRAWPLPGHRDGHDLSLRPDGSYFVTTSDDGVWVFDPAAGSFAPFDGLNPAHDVKAISESDGVIAWMQAEESWWAHGFWARPVTGGAARRFPVPELHLYKVRLAQPDGARTSPSRAASPKRTPRR